MNIEKIETNRLYLRQNNEKDKIHNIGIPGTDPGVVYGRRLC